MPIHELRLSLKGASINKGIRIENIPAAMKIRPNILCPEDHFTFADCTTDIVPKLMKEGLFT